MGALKNYLENIRQKPLRQRITIMWVTVACCTLLVVVSWGWWMQNNLKVMAKAPILPTEVSGQVNDIKDAVPNLKDGFTDGLNALLDQAQSDATTSTTTE